MNINNSEIVVVDYNTGNVDSVIKAVKYFDKTVMLSNDPQVIEKAEKIILPGQGSFDYGMEQLKKLNLIDLIKKKVQIEKKPILGICLGMQILADKGYENKTTEGLGFISGEVKKIPTKYKLPHIGWNEVSFAQDSEIFNGVENNKDFYFVHSYFFECSNKKDILAKSNYGFEFPTIISVGNVFGFQFHPEKSLKNGLKLLNNFLSYSCTK